MADTSSVSEHSSSSAHPKSVCVNTGKPERLQHQLLQLSQPAEHPLPLRWDSVWERGGWKSRFHICDMLTKKKNGGFSTVGQIRAKGQEGESGMKKKGIYTFGVFVITHKHTAFLQEMA